MFHLYSRPTLAIIVIFFAFFSLNSVSASGSSASSLNASSIFEEAPIYFSGGFGASWSTAADVNRDGKMDILVVHQYPDGNSKTALGVLLGNGDGTFQQVALYDTGGLYSTAVAAADLNGDGKADAVVTNASGVVSVLLGNGDGTFQAATTYWPGGENPAAVAIGDVNGDGKPDLLVANYYFGNGNYSRGSIGILLGNGNGTFQPAVALDSGGQTATGIALGDINGDGRLDVAVVNSCSSDTCAIGGVSVFLGSSSGLQLVGSYSSGGSTAYSVAIRDVNGDGKPDLLVTNYYALDSFYDSALGVLIGNGDGTFQSPSSYHSGGYGFVSLALADVDRDGIVDVLAANQCSDRNESNSCTGLITIMRGTGSGSFQVIASYASGGAFTTSVSLADLNSDGILDVLVSNSCTDRGGACIGNVGVLLGTSNGTFSAAPHNSSSGRTPYALAAADINGDGETDLVIANQCISNTDCTTGSVDIWRGHGDGSFTRAATYPTNSVQTVSLAVADVNSDNRPDILLANRCASSSVCTTGGVTVLLQKVDGSFGTGVNYSSGASGAGSIAAADFNGDGKTDLVVAAGGVSVSDRSGVVSIFTGNGNGTFSGPVLYRTGGIGANAAAIADLNRDGKLDIVVSNNAVSTANQVNGSVGVLLGNGDGSFQSPVVYDSAGLSPASVAVADINADGYPDVLITNSCATSACTIGSMAALLGNGDGSLQPALLTPVPQRGAPESIADFDGDGILDVAGGSGNFLAFGNGDGTFQPYLILGAEGPGLATADFNHDGKTDVAVGALTVLLNRSVTSFLSPTTIALTSGDPDPSYVGQTVNFVATIGVQNGGSPSGFVEFREGTTPIGTAPIVICNCPSNRTATFSTASLIVGPHMIYAVYQGDSNYRGSASATVAQTVLAKTATSMIVNSSLGSIVVGQSVTFTAHIFPSGTTGTVTFYDGSSIIGSASVNSSGDAALSISTLSVGVHTISAVYGGSVTYSGSSATLSQTVNKANTTSTIISQSSTTSVAGQPVIVAFGVSPIAPGSGTLTGTVTVSDGVGDACTAAVGSGSCSLSFASAGSKTLKAAYNGDSNFNPSTSASLNHNVTDFSITPSPVTQTVKAGQKTTYKITLTSMNGFAGTVSLSCTGLPANTTCAFGSNSVSLVSSGTVAVNVTAQTAKTTPSGTYNSAFVGRFGSGSPATGGLAHNANFSIVVK
jgi:hypothetical protein